VDVDRLAWVDTWVKEQQELAHAEIANITGFHLKEGECTTTSAIMPLLESIGAPASESYNKEYLSTIDHPVIPHLLRARRFDKISTMYVEPTIAHLTSNNRIHTNFHQLKKENEGNSKGTISGRISCSNVNLQQQPSTDPEIAPVWRSIYVPDTDIFGNCDYSQQEPRLLVHFSDLVKFHKGSPMWKRYGERIKGGHEAAEKYRKNPDMDFHKMMTDITGLAEKYGKDLGRKYAKKLFLGRVYGMGDPKLCHSLGLPTKWVEAEDWKGNVYMKEIAGEEGQRLIDILREKAPFAPLMAEVCRAKVKQQGYITTLLGRRRNFPLNQWGKYDWLHKSLNALIQGSAADQTKLAMAILYEEGYPLQLQVHDSVNLSLDSIEQGMEVKEIMENCVKLNIPVKVDLEVGRNWGLVKKVA